MNGGGEGNPSARLGHTSARAALIYQHATTDRDQTIAGALSKLAVPR
jgi:hypothetical protein